MNAEKPRIIAIITARGGSKRLPGKNLRLLAGKPLIAWTIQAAKASEVPFHALTLSTDDEEIARVGATYGAEVPLLRPPELATDEATSLAVVQHMIRIVEAQDKVVLDWVLLLQPTSPLRQAGDIVSALALANDSSCDSVVGVTEMPVHPSFAKRIDGAGALQPWGEKAPEDLRRQDIRTPAYYHNGAIYLTRRNIVMQQHSLYGTHSIPYVMPVERSIDIDTQSDFDLAEYFISKNVKGTS